MLLRLWALVAFETLSVVDCGGFFSHHIASACVHSLCTHIYRMTSLVLNISGLFLAQPGSACEALDSIANTTEQTNNQSQRSGTHTVQGWTANCSNVALTSLPVSRSQWQRVSYSYSWVRQGQQKVKGETQSGRVLIMWPFVPSNMCSLQMASEGMFSLLLN